MASVTFDVLIGRLGSAPQRVKVKSGSTVKEVFEKANISLQKVESIWLNGARATKNAKVKKGDILSIVAPREAGK